MSNPLVAQRQDSTTALSGVPILESVEETKKGIESGNWASGVLGAAGAGLDALGMAVDPFGAVLAAGVGWLMEHVGPVSDALDSLTGDPDEIKAHSETWKNVSEELADIGEEMTRLVRADTAGWTGEAGDAYRKRSEEIGNLLAAAKGAAAGAAEGVGTAGEIVGAVRMFVRDIIAELVGHLVSWALQVLATLGIAMAWVVPQVVAEVAKVASRIADITTKLVKAIKTLVPMLDKLGKGFGKAADALKKIKGDSSKGGPAGTKPAGADGGKGPDGKGPEGKGPDTTKPTGADGTPPGPNGPPPPKGGGKDGAAGNHPAGNRDGSAIRDNNRGPGKESTPDKSKNTCGDPIDVASGDVVLPETDVELAGVLPLVLRRVHLSSYRVGWLFGASWASTLDQRIEVDGSGVCFAADDGTLLFYPHPEPVALPVAGPRRRLTLGPDGYAIEEAGGDRTLHFGTGAGVLRLRAITDRHGNRIDFDRDDYGVPAEIRHSGGYRIRVESEDGRITGLYLRGADNGSDLLLRRYGYRNGHLSEVTNASGVPTRFDHDAEGRMTGWTDRNGAWYRYSYDAGGRVVRADGSGGFLSGTMSYSDGVTRWTNSLGETTAYHLNSRGQTVREVDPAGNEVSSDWDEFDRLLSRTDALGRTVRYSYDGAGNLLAETGPDGVRASYEYDDLGLPVVLRAPDGSVSRLEYDARGSLTAVVDPTGAVTRYSYDERGNPATVTNAVGEVRRVEANAAGLPIATIDPSGATTRCERDAFGRPSALVDPLGGTTRFGWTVDGEPAWRTLPDGSTERWGYDGEGNLRTHVDVLGEATHTEVTHFDLPTAEVRPDGTRLEFGYDTELRLTSVTNQQGLVWRYEYDPAGNLARETDFNGRAVSYRHDAAGQLIARTNSDGQTTTYVRNVFGDVVERRTPDGTATFAYDELGRLTAAWEDDAQIAFQRDAAGRIVAESINGRTVASVYDALGRRIRRRTPSGAESTWEYDADDRPIALHAAGRTLRFGYDAAGREVSRALGPNAVLVQDWDRVDRLRSQRLADSDGRTVAQRSYTYRPDGMLTGVEDSSSGPRTFDFDRMGRVTGVRAAGWRERYVYDPAGNVADAAWPAAADSAEAAVGPREYSGTLVRRAGQVRYEHDGRGRMVLRQQRRLSREPATWRYSWDADDRLVGVLTPDGDHWRYRYDPLGRRVAKQRQAPDGRVLEQIEFAWDGALPVEQAHTGESGVRVTVWDHEPGTFRPLAQRERSSLRDAPQQWIDERFHSIITDLVGSPSELVDDDGGIAWSHRTTLWGSTLAETRGGTRTPWRFPGQYADPESGLNYNFHRHYDPSTGRYASTDPLGLAAGPNPHAYVANPHAWIDPLGLVPCTHAVAVRNGGVPHQAPTGARGYMFPDKKTAKKAASEAVGDLGPNLADRRGPRPETRAIRKEDFRSSSGEAANNKDRRRNDAVIGREMGTYGSDGKFNTQAGWRDDRYGHDFSRGRQDPAQMMGPHINVWGPGVDKSVHMFYP